MKEDIKVIFLDVDGVLNSYDWRLKNKDKREDVRCLDENAIKCLGEIVETTNAKIVLSSSWRTKTEDDYYMNLLKRKLKKFGMSIMDITPMSRKNKPRGWEIRDWLKANKKLFNVTNFAIIDDDWGDITGHVKTLLPFFVKTSFKDGLKEKHIDIVKHVLNGGRVNLIIIPKRKDPEWKSNVYWFRKFIQETIEE
jgi:hypothetical protein